MGIQFCGGNYPKKNWVGWKAVLLSLSDMEEDQQAQIRGNEFWTFTQVELNLGFSKLNYVRFRWIILCGSN